LADGAEEAGTAPPFPPREVIVCAFPFMFVPTIVIDLIVDAGLAWMRGRGAGTGERRSDRNERRKKN